jgi:serine/threonine protein phosphatase PrpC
MTKLSEKIKSDEMAYKWNVRNMIYNIHEEIEQELNEDESIDKTESGSTLLSLFIKDNRMFCINTGDCRAIMIT